MSRLSCEDFCIKVKGHVVTTWFLQFFSVCRSFFSEKKIHRFPLLPLSLHFFLYTTSLNNLNAHLILILFVLFVLSNVSFPIAVLEQDFPPCFQLSKSPEDYFAQTKGKKESFFF